MSCFLLSFFLIIGTAGCATSPPNVQPQINGLVVAQRFDKALKILSEQKSGYGRNNELLYLLDYALVLQLSGHYQESTGIFEQAKTKYDELFTQSVTKISASWLWNDYTRAYRGEDFERVMMNIFQAVNYAALENIEEALVEARDVDSILGAINAQYRMDQKNVYKEDAFARLFMGILYEAGGGQTNLNDALISYQKALETYENDYRTTYKLEAPLLLKENLLTVSAMIDERLFKEYRKKFPAVPYQSLKEKQKEAEVYLIHYHGLSPLKYQDSIVVPLPGGYLSKVAFPRYKKRIFEDADFEFSAVQNKIPRARQATITAEDIAAIAIQNLENRKVRVIAKAVARPVGKYFLERQQENYLRHKAGESAADGFRYASDWYNIYTEQADLRTWQTLPAEIRIARLMLEPGEYEFFLNEKNLGKAVIKAGEKKFLVVRTSY